MSGPKVVRIVTREEIIEICEGHLARLAQALEHWTARGQRLGELADAQVAASRERHAELRALLAQDRFNDLQKQVPLEIAFLQRDLLRMEDAAVATALDKRQRTRRVQDNAGMLLRTLEARELTADTALLASLRALARGDKAVPDSEALLSQGFSLLVAAPAAASLTAQQAELARQLRLDLPGEPAQDWRAGGSDATLDPRMAGIDRHIAELETLDGEEAAQDFIRRAASLDAMESGPRKNMLMDSLVLDLSAAAAARRVREAMLQQLRELGAEVQRIAGAQALQGEVARALAERDLGGAPALMDRCKAVIADELKRVAALARRAAILDGLASLGYEVREGMATAWAEQGKVALRKTATPGYGVEVGGAADTGRLQVRAVAFDGDRDLGRDRDIEAIWCGEFSRLQKLLAANGDTLEIEKALAVGAVPLKTVDMGETNSAADVAAPLVRRL